MTLSKTKAIQNPITHWGSRGRYLVVLPEPEVTIYIEEEGTSGGFLTLGLPCIQDGPRPVVGRLFEKPSPVDS